MPALIVKSAASHAVALDAVVGSTTAAVPSAPAPMSAVPRSIEGIFMAVRLPAVVPRGVREA